LSNDKLEFGRLASNGSQSLLLRTIRDYSPVSRSSISRILGMNAPAVTRTATELLNDKLILEKPLSDTSGQRRKRGLVLNPSAAHCLGLLIGPTEIEGCIVDCAYRTVVRKQLEGAFDAMKPRQVVQAAVSFVNRLRAQAPGDNKRCLGLAAVAPGLTDIAGRRCLACSTMPHLVGVQLADMLEKNLNLPVFLTTGSQAHLRAVERLDINAPANNMLFVFYSQGIGASLKMQGAYIRGKDNLAGEIGHMPVTDEPIPCGCGGTGCLEALASKAALARLARQAVREFAGSSLAALSEIKGDDVLKAAADGDRLGVRLTRDAFAHLARAVAGIAVCMAPDHIVFSHSISAAGEEMFQWLCAEIRSRLSGQLRDGLSISVSTINSHISSMGAAFMGLDLAM
jgi:predicted NBD/HSP70 family sugar kinase